VPSGYWGQQWVGSGYYGQAWQPDYYLPVHCWGGPDGDCDGGYTVAGYWYTVWVDTSHTVSVWVDTSDYATLWVDTSQYVAQWVDTSHWTTQWIDTSSYQPGPVWVGPAYITAATLVNAGYTAYACAGPIGDRDCGTTWYPTPYTAYPNQAWVAPVYATVYDPVAAVYRDWTETMPAVTHTETYTIPALTHQTTLHHDALSHTVVVHHDAVTHQEQAAVTTSQSVQGSGSGDSGTATGTTASTPVTIPVVSTITLIDSPATTHTITVVGHDGVTSLVTLASVADESSRGDSVVGSTSAPDSQGGGNSSDDAGGALAALLGLAALAGAGTYASSRGGGGQDGSTPTGAGSQVDPQRFRNMTWQERRDWLQQMQDDHRLGGWLNVFSGVMDYAEQSSYFKSMDLMKAWDGAVLAHISEGVEATYSGVLPTSCAGQQWSDFFGALIQQQETGTVSDEQLKHLWGVAEQSSIEEGKLWAKDHSTYTEEDLRMALTLKGVTDMYRQSARDNTGLFAGIGPVQLKVADPRIDRDFISSFARENEWIWVDKPKFDELIPQEVDRSSGCVSTAPGGSEAVVWPESLVSFRNEEHTSGTSADAGALASTESPASLASFRNEEHTGGTSANSDPGDTSAVVETSGSLASFRAEEHVADTNSAGQTPPSGADVVTFSDLPVMFSDDTQQAPAQVSSPTNDNGALTADEGEALAA
jgi:hypothetical protein